MKALVYTGPRMMEVRDVPDPTPGDGEVLVKIHSVGICGSDMHAWLGHDPRRPAPLTLGHEAAGIVVDGPGVGRRVTINPLQTCGTCDACRRGRDHLCPERMIMSMPPREGSFAEFAKVPERSLVTVPDGISFSRACLAEPLAVCWHAVQLVRNALDRSVTEGVCLIQGGGAIGYGAALVLRAFGAEKVAIAEPNAVRRAYLRKIGPFDVFDPDNDPPPPAPHVVIDAVGLPATRAMASEIVRPGGVICHLGLSHGEGGLDTRRATLQEITFVGSFCYTAQDFRDTAQAIFDEAFGKLDWTETRVLDDGPEAFESLLSGKVATPKLILQPLPN